MSTNEETEVLSTPAEQEVGPPDSSSPAETADDVASDTAGHEQSKGNTEAEDLEGVEEEEHEETEDGVKVEESGHQQEVKVEATPTRSVAIVKVTEEEEIPP